MLYSLKQGKSEQRILEQCRRENLPLPDTIKNAPQLYLGLELYWGAFFDLCSSRTGWGDGPISWQSVEEYAIINQLDDEQKEDLHFLISKMDEVFMKWKRENDGNTSGVRKKN